MWTIDTILVAINAVATVGLGVFIVLGKKYGESYLAKKGENLATHEDIDKLVDQVKAVTEATKKIEAEISQGIWDKQKRWEMKREVLFEVSKVLARVEERLIRGHAVLCAAKGRVEDAGWLEEWHEFLVGWRETIADFESAVGLVVVVCTAETTAEFIKFRGIIAGITGGLAKKDAEAYESRSEALTTTAWAIRSAIRKELGIEAMF